MRYALFFLLTLFVYNGKAQSGLYFPPNGSNTWDTLAPSSFNYCQPQIDSLYDFLETNNSKAFLLLKDGKIVLEKYFGTFERDSFWYWASAGKTLTASLVGIAQEDGLLSINDLTSQYLGTGWTNSTLAQENNIRIVDQLSMTTGLDDAVPDPDCTLSSCLDYTADAGTRWAYHNAPYTLLDTVIEVASGQTLNQYNTANLRVPIGMNGAYIPVGYNSVYFSNARSFARFGLFLLARGQWNGSPVLGDTAYFNAMTAPSQSINNAYGYLTWLNSQSTFMVPQSQFVFNGPLNPNAPADLFAAMGKNGQFINVVPSENMVWIRMGNPPAGGAALVEPLFNDAIWEHINALPCILPGVESLNTATFEVKVYPNPVKDQLTIDCSTPLVRLELLSANGAKTEVSASTTLSVGHLPVGVYWLIATDHDGRIAKASFVVQ